METPKEKVIDLLSKINNEEITPEIWNEASEYAKKDLKRKAYIVVSEILDSIPSRVYWRTYDDETPSAITFWQEVKAELNKL